MVLAIKLISCVFVMIVLCGPAIGAKNESEKVFEEVTGGIFDDIEFFLISLVQAIAVLFALASAAMMILGWFAHNEKLFMKGAKGIFVIIAAAVVYFVAVGGFNWVVKHYW